MKKVIITGSTGMVGRGVLYECLEDDRIEKVLVVNRSSLEVSHPKLSEILLKDFTKVESIKNHLRDYDACFYCMGFLLWVWTKLSLPKSPLIRQKHLRIHYTI